jgi:hypothetical protein
VAKKLLSVKIGRTAGGTTGNSAQPSTACCAIPRVVHTLIE